MAHIAGFGRDQLLLLPEAVDDYVEADNSVRFIDVFVDGLDLAAAGFGRVEAKATGRPGYAPGDLLKLYIYGYLNRVRSSRRLERECRCNVEVIWLLGTLKPDFKTIADFRRDNRAAFRAVFRQFVLLCRRLDLYGRELLAVDGTRIKAGQQQGPQLHPLFAARVHPCSRRAVGGLPQAARRGRCRGRGDKRRGAHQEPGREDRCAQRETRPLPSDARPARTNWRGPDLADRSRQPGHGRPHEGRRRL